ncbi:MAG: response regulator, partial [Flavitalea sp.]
QLSKEQREYTKSIRNCGENLITVIKDILITDVMDYSKMEGGKAELEQNDLDLRSMIEEVLDAFAARSISSGIEFWYDIDENISPAIVGDHDRLRQILMNLTENAVKFTTTGEIAIHVKLLSAEGATNTLEFEVRDTGKGMHEAELKELSAYLSGAGDINEKDNKKLGLAISKKLIALMGGEITVSSKPGEGASFRFTIKSKAGVKRIISHFAGDLKELENKKILLATTNPSCRATIEKHLLQWKTALLPVALPDEIIPLLAKHNDIDAILIDVAAGDMKNIELAKAIHERYPLISVILLMPAGEERNHQYDEIVSGLVPKPVKQYILGKSIITALKNKGRNVSSAEQAVQKLSDNFSQQYPLRILIGEDDVMNQQLAMMIFKRLGYQVDIANNGKEVLEIVSHKNYDLIFMDVQMPEMDGLEATRMIRLCLTVQPIIIAMTANAMLGDREECLRSGMDDYISKPINFQELTGLLEKWAVHIQQAA